MFITELKKRVEKLVDNFENDSAVIVKKYEDEALTSQLKQLWDGKNTDDKDLTPSYLNDPYFKSKESAQRYSDWKDKITPNSKRSKNTPNLFINGYFYDSIEVKADNGDMIIKSEVPLGQKLERKYKGLFGLTIENLAVIKKLAYIDYIKKIKLTIGL